MKQRAWLLTVLLAAGVPALAQTPPPPPPPATPFQQHKAATIAKVEAHIAREQALLSCLQAAQDRAAVKACKRSARPVH